MKNTGMVKLKARPFSYIIYDGTNLEAVKTFTGCPCICKYDEMRLMMPDSEFRIYIVTAGMYIVKDENGEISAYTKEMFERKFEQWDVHDDMKNFFLFSHRNCGEDECFVMERAHMLMAGEKMPVRRKRSDLADSDEYLRCVICHEPATVIDCHFPHDTMHNRCTKHHASFIDPVAWDETGVAVEVCREHWDMLNVRHSIDDRIDWLDKNDRSVTGIELRGKLVETLKALDYYMKATWPGEQMGPKKEDKK